MLCCTFFVCSACVQSNRSWLGGDAPPSSNLPKSGSSSERPCKKGRGASSGALGSGAGCSEDPLNSGQQCASRGERQRHGQRQRSCIPWRMHSSPLRIETRCTSRNTAGHQWGGTMQYTSMNATSVSPGRGERQDRCQHIHMAVSEGVFGIHGVCAASRPPQRWPLAERRQCGTTHVCWLPNRQGRCASSPA